MCLYEATTASGREGHTWLQPDKRRRSPSGSITTSSCRMRRARSSRWRRSTCPSRSRRRLLLEVKKHEPGRGDYGFAEFMAITEYLAETFPFPEHPRLVPADLRERGVCREVTSWVRDDLAAIREERNTHSVFLRRAGGAAEPASDAGGRAAPRAVGRTDPRGPRHALLRVVHRGLGSVDDAAPVVQAR